MQFTFSIRNTLKEAWTLFKKHWQFFVAMTLVTVVLNLLGGEDAPLLLSLILFIASLVWAVVMMKVSLAVADNQESRLNIHEIKSFLPHWKEVLSIVGVAILVILIVLGGTILLIIPGIYFAFRLSFSYLAYLDRKEGVKKALRFSWDMTKGGVIWTVILTSIVSGLLYLVGFILVGVGLLITYPLALILMARLYRTLAHHHTGGMEVVPQPVEIPAHTEDLAEASVSEVHTTENDTSNA